MWDSRNILFSVKYLLLNYKSSMPYHLVITAAYCYCYVVIINDLNNKARFKNRIRLEESVILNSTNVRATCIL